MLMLGRREGQTILIGPPTDPIAVVKVVEIDSGNTVRLGVEARSEVEINRPEWLERKRREEEAAA